jgi:hypothetical protein
VLIKPSIFWTPEAVLLLYLKRRLRKYTLSPCLGTLLGQIDRTGSGYGGVEGSCEHGNEPSGSIKCWEVLE